LAKIKICGITNLADGQLAVELGAELLGFNFYRDSPRYIEPLVAAEIIAQLPKKAVMVGLFVNAPNEYIRDVLGQCPLDMAQLHGNESNAYCRAVGGFGVSVMKAFRVKTPEDIDRAEKYDTELILLDAFREELYGGTGHTFDWSWIKTVSGKKIFLAGGIGPDNIRQVLAVETYGIDLCSGVEKEPGVKDPDKMKLLFKNIADYYE